jgi:hypothetical protein
MHDKDVPCPATPVEQVDPDAAVQLTAEGMRILDLLWSGPWSSRQSEPSGT